MNKSAIQKYAIWARNELRDQIAKRGYYFGIDADGINVDGKDETCVYARDGRLLTETERKQRNELFRLVKEKGFDQVVEEVSYTWFNRLIALRFMEVNDYLPEHIRVLSNANNEFKPEIKTRALDLEDPHFDKKKILDLIDKNNDEELYRYLLLTECNALNDILPQMFEKIGGYTELLLPNNLLKADSVIGKLVSDIDEDDWDVKSEGGQVQIIGWLYQYYNQELKDQTFNDLKKKNKKISKERIPAATQLFTPDWIVHYMVENSLGRMWIEGHPNDDLKSTWKYYLDEAEQEPEVEEQLKEIHKEYSKLNPQDIKFLDPAMGSGHILVVAFDILMQIYESQGIRPREAAKSILENNLYGLDIDDRAAQLAYFAVMMKAREYDRRIFSRGIQPNLYSIQESNGIDDSLIEYVAGGDKKLYSDLKTLVNEMKDAKEYGSIITVSQLNFTKLEERLKEIEIDPNLLGEEAIKRINPLIKVGKTLASKFEIVCTNPPYMGNGNMNNSLSTYLKQNYPDHKSDLFAAFFKKSINFAKQNGLLAFLSPYVWMFIQTYKSVRELFIDENRIQSLIQFEYSAFSEATVPICSFVISKHSLNLKGVFIRLTDFRGGMKVQEEKALEAIQHRNLGFIYERNPQEFRKIPGIPIAYWLHDYSIFDHPSLGSLYESGGRTKTHNNDRYIRYWWEISNRERWAPLSNGGEYRKWYGNHLEVIDWSKEAKNEYASHGGLYNKKYWNKCGICWNLITSATNGFRVKPAENHFSSASPTIISEDKMTDLVTLGLLNSKVGKFILNVLNPTLNTTVSDVFSIPLIAKNKEYIASIAQRCIEISKQDWDDLEISQGFTINPIIKYGEPYNNMCLSTCFERYSDFINERFQEIKKNEQSLNDYLVRQYNLGSDVTSEVKNEDVTIRTPNLKEDIKSLISFGVGNILGNTTRLNLEIDIDKDNIIPIGENEYFDDDLTARFIEWTKIMFGSSTLEENLRYIANALGGVGSPREVIRRYFLNDFYADHCKMYKKRPIYWLFDSGKKNGFKCLIYMHRYTPDTLARIRTDYVHEQQERYRSQIKHIHETIDTVPKSEQVKMKKELKDLEAKSKEVAVFEEKLHHLADQMIEINLDDGVKHNYALFQDVLAKIK